MVYASCTPSIVTDSIHAFVVSAAHTARPRLFDRFVLKMEKLGVSADAECGANGSTIGASTAAVSSDTKRSLVLISSI